MGATRDFKIWLRNEGLATAEASATYKEITRFTDLQFTNIFNIINPLAIRVYARDGLVSSDIGNNKIIRVTRKDSTNGEDGTLIRDFVIREFDVDKRSRGLIIDINCMDLGILVHDRILPRETATPRVGDGSNAAVEAIVKDYIADVNTIAGSTVIDEGTIDTTGNAAKSIQYRIEYDSVFRSVADLARLADCYFWVDGYIGTGDRNNPANHDPTVPRLHFVNPSNALFTTTAPDAARTLDRTVLREVRDIEDEQTKIEKVTVIGAGAADSQIIASAGNVSAKGDREFIFTDSAIEDQTTAQELADTILARQTDVNRPENKRLRAVRATPEYLSSPFTAKIGDLIKVTDGATTIRQGIYWGFEYKQMREEFAVLVNRNRDHLVEALNRIERLTLKDKATSQVAVPASGSFTEGSVLFADSGGDISEDNANLFWDDTNKRLGIGTATPSDTLTIDTANGFAAYTTHPTFTLDTQIIDKKYVDDAVQSAAVEVREVDGTPTITSASTIEFDQAAGFVVTDQTGGVARVSGSFGVSDHGALTGLADDDHTQYHTDARALSWLGTRSTSDLPEGTNLYFTDERVDDRVSALIIGGNQLTATYDDGANTLTLDVSDGAGSGLDADLLDGVNLAGTGNDGLAWNYVARVKADGVMEVGRYIDFHHVSNSGVDYDARLHTDGSTDNELFINSNKIWHQGNDGPGSGLDADSLDGVQGGSFLRSDATDTATGALTFTNTATFNGSVILGNNASDNVTFNADILGHLTPNATTTYDLGSTSQGWRSLYLDPTDDSTYVSVDSGVGGYIIDHFSSGTGGNQWKIGTVGSGSGDNDGYAEFTLRKNYDYTENHVGHTVLLVNTRSTTVTAKHYHVGNDPLGATDPVYFDVRKNGSNQAEVWVVAEDFSSFTVETWHEQNYTPSRTDTAPTGTAVLNTKTALATASMLIGDLDTNNLLVKGTTTLGDATSDTVTFVGNLASNIVPDGIGTRELGTLVNYLKNVYSDVITVNTSIKDIAGNVLVDANNNTFENVDFIEFTDRISDAATPGAGKGRLYTKNDSIFFRNDGGTVFDLTDLSGDDLGNHTATQALDMANNAIYNLSFISDGTTYTAQSAISFGVDLDLNSDGVINLETDDVTRVTIGNTVATYSIDIDMNANDIIDVTGVSGGASFATTEEYITFSSTNTTVNASGDVSISVGGAEKIRASGSGIDMFDTMAMNGNNIQEVGLITDGLTGATDNYIDFTANTNTQMNIHADNVVSFLTSGATRFDLSDTQANCLIQLDMNGNNIISADYISGGTGIATGDEYVRLDEGVVRINTGATTTLSYLGSSRMVISTTDVEITNTPLDMNSNLITNVTSISSSTTTVGATDNFITLTDAGNTIINSENSVQIQTDGLTRLQVNNTSINFNEIEASGFVLQNVTSDPVTTATGRMWYRSDLD